jgi:3-methyladenine DNA glycosylase AlkD
MIEELIRRVQETKHGFKDIRAVADETMGSTTREEGFRLAESLFASDIHQARVLATFILGHLAAKCPKSLAFLETRVSHDPDWRVQEILAKAFDGYCSDIGYGKALPVIREWMQDRNSNARRAVTEGLRIWTARPYFRDHPEIAIQLLSGLKDDESEYVRKSVGNALRDISKKHGELVNAELQKWDLSSRSIGQTYRLASKFL